MRRYDAYVAALSVLSGAREQDLSNEFIVSGIIDKFSLQFELGWKTLKDLLRHEGVAQASSGSPRDIIKAAYRTFDFIDEDVWLEMLRDRNNIMHIYDGEEAQRLVQRILESYIPALEMLRFAIMGHYGDELDDIA